MRVVQVSCLNNTLPFGESQYLCARFFYFTSKVLA
nr:MAG TPA: hypothetical protein [Caudoviricetes sp.]